MYLFVALLKVANKPQTSVCVQVWWFFSENQMKARHFNYHLQDSAFKMLKLLIKINSLMR